MNNNPNLEQVLVAAEALRPLLEELVLVGGCAAGLLVTDQASAPVRPTIDVDVIVQATPLSEYYAFCERLKELGFAEASDEGVICRWKKGSLILDVMPIDAKILGFTNSWYELAVKFPIEYKLNDDLVINVINPALFIATKLESFSKRGSGDYTHHDIEDIINIVDGRSTIVTDINDSDGEVIDYISEEIETLLGDAEFTNVLPGHLNGIDAAVRLPIVLSRLREIAGI